ncbi:MAG: pimeloyl-ACP methyl ester carboxylesterase [Sphingomonas echinoides]|jgi:pimeloyl-ACP methyl ester carboxylesterase
MEGADRRTQPQDLTMSPYENRYWWSNDGVRLHYRDYPGSADRPPILCLPGLTRNARDYDELARRLSPQWRVIAVDLRGRGESGYAKDPMSYVPLTYVQDIEGLLGELAVPRYIAIGTSLGGIVTMLLAGTARETLAGAVLNDVGPEISPEGLSRIRSYVGKSNTWPTWVHAARAVAEANGDVFPTYQLEDWLAMAKRLYRLNSAGRIVLDYDMKIAEPFRVPGNEAGPDMWRALDRLKTVPTLIVRGGKSDILAAATAERMKAALDQAELVTLPDIGHAPTLNEPAAVAGVDRLLARIAAEPAAT